MAASRLSRSESGLSGSSNEAALTCQGQGSLQQFGHLVHVALKFGKASLHFWCSERPASQRVGTAILHQHANPGGKLADQVAGVVVHATTTP